MGLLLYWIVWLGFSAAWHWLRVWRIYVVLRLVGSRVKDIVVLPPPHHPQHTHLAQSVFYTIKIVWGISLPEYPNLFSSYLIVIAEYPWRDKILISSVASGEVELGEEGQGWEADQLSTVYLSVFWVLCGYRVNILPIRPFKKNNISKVRHDNRTS